MTATWVAIAVTFALGVWALIQGRSANSAAEASAEAAKEANDLARHAEERASRLEAQATERNHVEWETGLKGLSWLVTNTGQDTALEVSVVLQIEGDEAPSVHQLGDVQGLHQALGIDVDSRVSSIRTQHRNAVRSTAEAGAVYAGPSTFSITERIHWRSPAGRWYIHAPDEHKIPL